MHEQRRGVCGAWLTKLSGPWTMQRLPYGFFISVLPLFLRQAGWSRTAIGFYGLAVDILSEGERGPGNAAQVVGFKVGMLCTGGILLADRIGYGGLFALGVGISLLWPLVVYAARRKGSGTVPENGC